MPIQVPNTAASGAYELRLFSNNSYTKLATSNGITVQPPPPANLTAAPANLYASQSVTATWSSILAPTANDWIGLYAVGATDSAVIAWQYAGGSASGSVPIQVPNTTVAGAYELRLFANNSYTKLATSNGFTVDPPPPATLSATGSASPGGSVTANWASILAPTANDWIGLYVPGAADSAVLSWHYTTGVAAGNVPVSLPANLAQGSYELRLFANNSYTKLATSATFGVGVMTLSFIHVDHLNTPRLIADATGTTVWKWDQQEPFGNDTPNQDPGATGATFDFPLRFPGQYADKETSLAYNYFRDFDPATGRYVQSDPIGIDGGLNTFAYVNGSPIFDRDPYGLDAGKTVNLSYGWSARIDMIPQTDGKFEIHVFDAKGKEIGLFGEKGWFDKHGLRGRPDICPAQIENDLKGKVVDIQRRRGIIKKKGFQDIKGNRWRVGPGSLGAVGGLGAIIHMMTIDACNNGTVGQCFCAMSAEMEGVNSDACMSPID